MLYMICDILWYAIYDLIYKNKILVNLQEDSYDIISISYWCNTSV